MNYEKLKELIISKDPEAGKVLLNLFFRDGEKFRSNLLLSGCLPEPFSFDFESKLHIINEFYRVCKVCESVLEERLEVDAKQFKYMYRKLLKTVLILREYNEKNIEYLTDAGLFSLPLDVQLTKICIFLENQDRLADKMVNSERRKNHFYNVLERDIARLNSDHGYISVTDNIEAGIEMADKLFRYMYYLDGKKKQKDENYIENDVDISPYNDPLFEKMGFLAQHRIQIEHIWEIVKYREWDFEVIRLENEQRALYYTPNDKQHFKLERSATERYRYRESNNVSKVLSDYRQQIRNSLNHIDDLSKMINLEYFENSLYLLPIDMLEESMLAFKIFQIPALMELDYIIDEEFLENTKIGKSKIISINELLLGIEFLQTIARIYSQKSHDGFDDLNTSLYKYLAPRIRIESLETLFTKVYPLQRDKVKELFRILTFKPNSELDLFSQPLVFVNSEAVIFVPSIIEQMNVSRIIEQHLSNQIIDISVKGNNYEIDTISSLKKSNVIEVNTAHVEFDAYDGKTVQFDLIAKFEDKIMLVEMKCLSRPYSPKELKNKEAEIDKGIAQVKRRVNILMHEWDKVRSLVNIDLPKDPPKKEDIILLVCTNIFDFTGKVKHGVTIIDDSSLVKFFVSPEIYGYSHGENESFRVLRKRLWKGTSPTIDEFYEFLKKPVAISDFFDNLEELPRPVIMMKRGEERLYYLDYPLVRDPFEKENNHFYNIIKKLNEQNKQAINKKSNLKNKRKKKKKRVSKR
ncbi:hypothetical protein [Paenibacillus oleatilyticus]|uniref:NERD domain-containing protein n=1 Tax=Paenibacillus oleatilyticus TaxID=2594886 RepID=A0ABV4V5A6_9BACL